MADAMCVCILLKRQNVLWMNPMISSVFNWIQFTTQTAVEISLRVLVQYNSRKQRVGLIVLMLYLW